jgi:hypothetical protein
MTPDTMLTTLARAARAFADEIERGLRAESSTEGPPEAGSAQSMLIVLDSVARINDEKGRGGTQAELRDIARAAGMDPRGTAGYYAPDAQLLETRSDGSRWITPAGRARLEHLRHLLAQ